MRLTLLAFGLAALAASPLHAKDIVVKIGHAGPLTGPIAHIGKDGENGARLAIEDANAKGTVIGGDKVKFELMGEDDQADPRQATLVAQRLVDAGVKGVVGHVTSGASIPASRVYDNAGIPVITPSSTNPKLTQQGYKVTFRVIANDIQQGSALAAFAAAKLGAKRIAIIDDRTAYGQGLADVFDAAAKKQGATIVAREFTTDKATDFMAILTKVKGASPDAVFYGGMDAQSGPMLRQMKQLGIGAKFLGGDGSCTGDMLKLAGDAMSSGVYCSQAGLPMDRMPGGSNFNTRYKARFNTDVQLYAPYSYDAATALIEAMRKANSIDPAKYLAALQSLTFKGVTGTIAFDAKGDIKDGGITLFNFKDGKWVPLAAN
jgi:branched-chain amino acid transport system substrate-binding protein